MWDNIERFAGDRINDLKNAADTVGNEVEYRAKQLRDNVVVPVIDNAMEAGLVPAKEGMFGRYLSGTEVPLTKIPADVKRAEQSKVNMLLELNKTKANDPQHQARIRFNNLVDQQNELGVDLTFHAMGHGNYTPDQISTHKNLQAEIDIINKQFPNMSAIYSTIADRNFGTQLKPFDPNNYNTSKYKGRGIGSGVDYDGKGIVDPVDGTTNTLGQYSVTDGVLNDRYDFDKNNGFTTADEPMYTRDGKQLPDPGKFTHGGAFAEKDFVQNLATHAGRFSQSLGLIRPGSGYDIRFDLGKR